MLLLLPSIIYHNAKMFPSIFHIIIYHLYHHHIFRSYFFYILFRNSSLQHFGRKRKEFLDVFYDFISFSFFFYISIIDNRLSTNIGKITHDDYVLWIIFVTCLAFEFLFLMLFFILLCFSCLLFHVHDNQKQILFLQFNPLGLCMYLYSNFNDS